MRLDHIAIWTKDLERLKNYYITFFGAKANNIYINPKSGLQTYFLTFGSGARIEIMYRPDIPENANDTIEKQHLGWIHIAFEVESMQEVDNKAKELSTAGYRILRGPRRTGDNYYEFETLDPDNNRLEICTPYTGQ